MSNVSSSSDLRLKCERWKELPQYHWNGSPVKGHAMPCMTGPQAYVVSHLGSWKRQTQPQPLGSFTICSWHLDRCCRSRFLGKPWFLWSGLKRLGSSPELDSSHMLPSSLLRSACHQLDQLAFLQGRVHSLAHKVHNRQAGPEPRYCVPFCAGMSR